MPIYCSYHILFVPIPALSSRESVDSPTEQPGNLAGISCTIHILPLSTMHTALSYTATLDPSSAATCAPPPAHARAPIHAHRMRQARVPKEWSCARALRCKWITRLTDSTNLGHAEVQHANCARAHGIRTRQGGQQAGDRGFPVGFGGGDAPVAAIRPGAGQQRHSETVAPTASARERDHGASAPRPSRPAVGTGANFPRRSRRCFASPRPPRGEARVAACSKSSCATSDRGERRIRTFVD